MRNERLAACFNVSPNVFAAVCGIVLILVNVSDGMLGLVLTDIP